MTFKGLPNIKLINIPNVYCIIRILLRHVNNIQLLLKTLWYVIHIR